MAYGVRVYDNIVPSELCKSIITKFEEEREEGRVFEGRTNSGVNTDTKLSWDFNITHNKDHERWSEVDHGILLSMGTLINKYATDFPEIVKYPLCDVGYNIQKYEKGSGFYDWHSDVGALSSVYRLAAVVIYLNTVQEGGETEFRDHDMSCKAVEGRALIFPPFWTHVHRSRMPVSESKYIINSFVEIQRHHQHD